MDKLKEKISNQKDLVLFISILASVFTVAIIVCICYKVAVSISDPLK